MATLTGKAISELPEATSLNVDDLLALSSNGTSRKLKVSTLINKALQSIPSTYRTAAAQDTIDAGKIDKNQGSANAGKFLVVGADGIVAPVTMYGAGLHNALYCGKYLGDSLTAAQSAAIRAGTFGDLYIGDYWTIGGVNYRIADFDYFYRAGDKECTTHHVVIVPDTNLDNQKMNDSNITTGGYTGSKMYTNYMATAKNKIIAAFGSGHILSHREYLTNAVANGRPSGGAWFDSTIELMSEAMCYGGTFFEPVSDGSAVPNKYSVACKQLNLFRHRPDMISNRQTFWLRNVVSATSFAFVGGDGNAGSLSASGSYGVRPAFPIY